MDADLWPGARARILLDPSIINLNTGSFGPLPRPVFERVTELRRRLAEEPMDFLVRQAPPRLWEARARLAAFLGGEPRRLVFTVNVTAAVNVVAAADVARGHLLAARHGRPGWSYLLGGENLEWRELHTIIADLVGVSAPVVTAGRAASYMAATWWELCAALTGKRPAVTRHEARMVGRYYWYDHSAAAKLGYHPREARSSLAEALSWLVTRPHVSPATRRSLRLRPEVFAARRGWVNQAVENQA